MKFLIYAYDNEKIMVEIPDDKEIKEIFVLILSGDEIVEVTCTDGSVYEFDSGTARLVDFDDGCYIVPKDKVDEWINFVPPLEEDIIMSYARYKAFNDEED